MGQEPDGAELVIKWFLHDFGQYAELCVVFDPNDEKAVRYAYDCEAKGPTTWADGGVEKPQLVEFERFR